MVEGKATLRYYQNWAIAYVDKQLGDYYFSLAPKYWYLQRPKEKPHITVVRKDIEIPSYDNWGFRDGTDLYFLYEPVIYRDSMYAWIDVYSEDIGNLREVLGLPRMRVGFDCYHLTVGNFKGSNAAGLKKQTQENSNEEDE